MWPTALSALGGAAGLGALLTPLLVHAASRRTSMQTQNTGLIDQLQQERDAILDRLDDSDRQRAALWDYVLRLRYWMVKGAVGSPPTMPDGLSVAAVRARAGAA